VERIVYMGSFSDFKKRSRDSIGSLTAKLDQMNKKESYKDERFWTPQRDSSGNGYAVIRFLPACQGEELPWAKYFEHAFQGTGGWYIEKSRTTLNEKDPVSEMNSRLWNSGVESDKDIARSRKRQTRYVSNIMVISDPANPENEGKVFLYRYGPKIFNKIQEAMKPEFEDEKPINPFDFWGGADFKLKIRKVGGYVNYDKSEFASPTELFEGDDSALERVWNQQHALDEFVNPNTFKSYDELKKKLDEVIGTDIRSAAPEKVDTVEDVAQTPRTSPPVSEEVSSGGEEKSQSSLEYFQELMDED
jgi:hypothetical protein